LKLAFIGAGGAAASIALNAPVPTKDAGIGPGVGPMSGPAIGAPRVVKPASAAGVTPGISPPASSGTFGLVESIVATAGAGAACKSAAAAGEIPSNEPIPNPPFGAGVGVNPGGGEVSGIWFGGVKSGSMKSIGPFPGGASNMPGERPSCSLNELGGALCILPTMLPKSAPGCGPILPPLIPKPDHTPGAVDSVRAVCCGLASESAAETGELIPAKISDALVTPPGNPAASAAAAGEAELRAAEASPETPDTPPNPASDVGPPPPPAAGS